MSLQVTIETTGLAPAAVGALRARLNDRSALNARIAADAEKELKKGGMTIAATRHATANRLGANPTGELTRAYEAIQKTSDAQTATLLVPRASPLRAAFGKYVCVPGPGKDWLTIPVAAEAYGHRAREFSDLHAMRIGPRKTLVLARKDASGHLTTMYVLVKSATIPENPDLIPFEKIFQGAADSADAFCDEAIQAAI